MWSNSFLITNLNTGTDISLKKLKIHATGLTFTMLCLVLGPNPKLKR